MVLHSRFRFDLVVKNPSGGTLHREETADWAACYEDLLFQAVVTGVLPNDGLVPSGTVAPIWGEADRPRVRAFRVDLPPLGKTYGRAIVTDRVVQVVPRLDGFEDELDSFDARAAARRTVRWWVAAAQREADGRTDRRRVRDRAPSAVSPPLSDFARAGGASPSCRATPRLGP